MATDYYDPKETYVIVSGHYVEGFSEDEHITVEPVSEELWTSHIGVMGEAGWSYNNNNSYKITIKLMQNSPSIPVLKTLEKSMLSHAVEVGNTSSGQYLGGGTDARFTTRTGVKFGKAMNDVTFTLICADWQQLSS